MGTQFWWFYDVLVLATAGGLLYAAIAKGFNKIVFQLVGFVLAFVVGVFGSDALAEPAYNMLYKESISSSIATEYEAVELYEMMAQVIGQTDLDDAPANIDSAGVEDLAEDIHAGTEAPAWFVEAAASVVEPLLIQRISPFPQQSLNESFTNDPELLRLFLQKNASGEAAAVASCLEEGYFRPYYVEMVRMALFLLLEVVIMIIVMIISSMAGNLEEQMHIRKFNRLLAVPVGLLEAACAVLFITVAVKLMVTATDNHMMLFNEETIAETKIFRYIYEKI